MEAWLRRNQASPEARARSAVQLEEEKVDGGKNVSPVYGGKICVLLVCSTLSLTAALSICGMKSRQAWCLSYLSKDGPSFFPSILVSIILIHRTNQSHECNG